MASSTFILPSGIPSTAITEPDIEALYRRALNLDSKEEIKEEELKNTLDKIRITFHKLSINARDKENFKGLIADINEGYNYQEVLYDQLELLLTPHEKADYAQQITEEAKNFYANGTFSGPKPSQLTQLFFARTPKNSSPNPTSGILEKIAAMSKKYEGYAKENVARIENELRKLANNEVHNFKNTLKRAKSRKDYAEIFFNQLSLLPSSLGTKYAKRITEEAKDLHKYGPDSTASQLTRLVFSLYPKDQVNPNTGILPRIRELWLASPEYTQPVLAAEKAADEKEKQERIDKIHRMSPKRVSIEEMKRFEKEATCEAAYLGLDQEAKREVALTRASRPEHFLQQALVRREARLGIFERTLGHPFIPAPARSSKHFANVSRVITNRDLDPWEVTPADKEEDQKIVEQVKLRRR